FRPYETENKVFVAAIWTRDGQDWQMADRLSAEEVRRRNAESDGQGFHAVDVTGYLEAGKEHYAVLWAKDSAKAISTEMRVGLDSNQLKTEDAIFHEQGYWRATTTLL